MSVYIEDGFESCYRPQIILRKDNEFGWYAEHDNGEVIELAYGANVPAHVVRDQLKVLHPDHEILMNRSQ